MYEKGARVKQIAQTLNVSTSAVHSAFRRAGYHRRRLNRDQCGAKNPSWKGGRRFSNGYLKVLSPDHPRADRGGYVFEHIIVAESIIGRFLVWKGIGHPESEVVHHLDHDRTNNHPDNLKVMTYLEHREHHAERRSSPTARNHGIVFPNAIYERLQDVATAWGTSINELVVTFVKDGLSQAEIRTPSYQRPSTL